MLRKNFREKDILMEFARANGESVSRFPESWAAEQYCYLMTTGRLTGKAHEIEIWFGMLEGRIYLLSGRGERADWVKNLRNDPRVRVRVGKETSEARARVVKGEMDGGEHVARRIIAAKYRGWREGQPLSGWAADSPLVELKPA